MRKPPETTDPVFARVRRLVAIYGDARASIVRELTRTPAARFTAIDAIRINSRISEILRELNARAVKWTADAVRTTYAERQTKTRVSLNVLGRRPGLTTYSERDKSSVSDIFVQTTRDLERANATIKRRTDEYLAAVMVGATAVAKLQAWDAFALEISKDVFEEWSRQAVTEGWSRQRLSGLIHDYLLSALEGADFIEVNGRSFSLDYYAELVARTRLREAQSEATINLCKEYENDLVEFSSHANPCDICLPLQDKVFSISGHNPNYPPLTDENTPPIHPNCGHSIAPTSEIAIQVREEFA